MLCLVLNISLVNSTNKFSCLVVADMKFFTKLIKVLAVVVCLTFFFILTFDVIVKFQKKLTTTAVQFYIPNEARIEFLSFKVTRLCQNIKELAY